MYKIKKFVYAFIVIVLCSGNSSVYAMVSSNNSVDLRKETRPYIDSMDAKPMGFLIFASRRLQLEATREKELLEQLENKRSFLGEKNPETWVAMNNLARFYRVEEKYQDAMILDEKTLNLREDVLGENHMDTLKSMNNLAEDYRLLGKYQKAFFLDKKALDLQEKILKGDKEASQAHNVAAEL